MRDTFVKTLAALAKEDPSIELVTGDLGFGVLKPFYEALPDQFTNAGIAEQNMTALAAGMALEGKTVFTYSIGNFPTLRCLEQIRNDCAYLQANVKIVCVGGGLVYGSLGMSHHATEDIAVLRALPGVMVICPGDLVEAEEAVKAIARTEGTVYLRLGRGGEPRVHETRPGFQIGKAIPLCETGAEPPDVALFSTGAILSEVAEARKLLQGQGLRVAQYSFPTVKPLDGAVALDCARRTRRIVTVEEHNIVGGFGGAVSEVLSGSGLPTRLLRLGLPDTYCSEVGSQDYLRAWFGLRGPQLAARIARFVAED